MRKDRPVGEEYNTTEGFSVAIAFWHVLFPNIPSDQALPGSGVEVHCALRELSRLE